MVLDCLGSLTKTVQGTKGFQTLYNGDRKLWEAAEALYLALLDAVEAMLAWLDENAWRRTMAIFKQGNYAKPLEDTIKTAVETRAKAFHEHLEYCQHERIQKIHIGIDRILVDIEDLGQNIYKQQAQQTEDLKQHTTALGQSITKQQARQTEDLIQHTLALCEALFRAREWDLTAKLDKLQEFIAQQPSVIMVSTSRPNMLSSLELLTCLNVQQDVLVRNVDRALQYGQALAPEHQARAATLLQHPQFQAWFRSGRSQILAVHANCAENDNSSMSSMTYFAGLFASMLDQTQSATPLVFVAGDHASPGDPLEGAEGMMRLLNFQLLARYGDKLDLSFVNYAFIEAIKSGEIHSLCELFRTLMTSVVIQASHSQGIMCLLDGLSFLETRARRSSFEIAIQCLRQLSLDIDGSGGLVVFKVMLLYPNDSIYARGLLGRDAILTLDDQVDGDGYAYDVGRLTDMSGTFMQSTRAPRALTPAPYV